MTAPAAIVASFVQPAAKLAMGDAVGGALGGFEALLAMLTQSLQGGADGQATQTAQTDTDTETPAETGDLAALLGGANPAAWLAHTLSRTTPEAEDGSTPVTCDAPQTKAPLIDAATLPAPTAEGTQGTAPDQTAPPAGPSGLETLLRGHQADPVDRALLERIMTAPSPSAAQPTQSPAPATPAQTAPAAEAAAAIQAAVQPKAEDQTPLPAETVAAPSVIAPPVEARAPAAPRKAAPTADSKVAKVETANAAPAPVKVAEAGDDVDALADELAPVEVAAHEAETPDAPAHTLDTAVQTLAARLETLAAGATAFAAQVRGAPETVAKLAAGILDKLEGKSTKFDLQLDPHGLGSVDVSVEIASDGKLTAQLGFDSQLGMSELRGRAQELRNALEQAGFSLADNALSFDFTGERRQQQAADEQPNRNGGAAFARAMSALDEDLAAAPTRYQARRGLDLLI